MNFIEVIILVNKKTKWILFLSILTIWSCTFNQQYFNREEDKEDAEKVITIFYKTIENKQYKEQDTLMATDFFNKVKRNDWESLLNKSDSLLGEIQQKKLIDWKTARTKGTNPSTEYQFVYEIKRKKFKSIETITLKKDNGAPKITYYHIQSEGFLNPAVVPVQSPQSN